MAAFGLSRRTAWSGLLGITTESAAADHRPSLHIEKLRISHQLPCSGGYPFSSDPLAKAVCCALNSCLSPGSAMFRRVLS